MAAVSVVGRDSATRRLGVVFFAPRIDVVAHGPIVDRVSILLTPRPNDVSATAAGLGKLL